MFGLKELGKDFRRVSFWINLGALGIFWDDHLLANNDHLLVGFVVGTKVK